MKLFTLLTVIGLAVAQLQGAEATAPAAHEQATNGLNWFTDWEKAKQAAKAENKPIFLYFTGSDWCPHCKKMDKDVLSQAEFVAAVGQSFIFMKVDFPRNSKLDKSIQDQNNQLRDKEFNVAGFPTTIIVDPNLKVLGKYVGSQGSPTAFVPKLQTLLANAK
jgi:protein disulfide-isomerase